MLDLMWALLYPINATYYARLDMGYTDGVYITYARLGVGYTDGAYTTYARFGVGYTGPVHATYARLDVGITVSYQCYILC